MASQYLARLGIVLGVDSGELIQGITAAQKNFDNLSKQGKRATEALAKDMQQLYYATEDYGKVLTKVELLEREIKAGRYMGAEQNAIDTARKIAKAYDEKAASMKKVNGVLSEQQKLQVSYQLTDFFTQIASGQNAMIAFIQQGGQLKDSMGGVGNAFRAIAQVFTPFRIMALGVAGAIGAVAYAFYSGRKEADEFNDAITLTNDYAGISYEKFVKLSDQLSSDTNKSVGLVKDSMLAVVSSGKFAEQSVLAVTNAVSTYARIAGIDGKSAAEKLMSGLDGTASGARRLNDQFNFLTLAQYRQIEALEKAGKKQEAAQISALALNKVLETQRRELGYLEQAWENTKSAASRFWEWLKGIGRPEQTTDAISRLRTEINDLQNSLNLPRSKEGDDRIRQQITKKKEELEAILETQRLLARSKSNVVGEKDSINAWADAGGVERAKQITAELAKTRYEVAIKTAMETADEDTRIQLEAALKVQEEIAKYQAISDKEKAVFGAQLHEQMMLKVMATLAERDKKLHDAKKKREWEADLKAFNEETDIKFRLMEERDKIFRDAQNKLSDEEYTQQQINSMYSLIGATQKELDIEKARIQAQKELAELMRSREFMNMSDEEKIKAKEMYENALKIKISNIELTESLQNLKKIYEGVWANMSTALENFVRTGKLNFKDFTKSIIQDLLIMNMKLQAMKILRGLWNMFTQGPATAIGGVLGMDNRDVGGGFSVSNLVDRSFTGIVSGDSSLSTSSAAIMGRKASGGSVAGGSTYLVGENGPELFTPSGSGTIIPNNMMNQGGGVTNVTNNYINAIDSKSFEQRLLESSNTIWAGYQYANKSLASNGRRA